jgi:hypothetical protein
MTVTSEGGGDYGDGMTPVSGKKHRLSPAWIRRAGWVPAVIFPGATALQLAAILRSGSAAGVDALTWFLFGIANLCLYFYSEKYKQPQAILGFLVTAALDFAIVGLARG